MYDNTRDSGNNSTLKKRDFERVELSNPEALTETPFLSDFLEAINKLDKRDREQAYAAFDLWHEWLISLPTALTRVELQNRKRLEYFLNGALAERASNA
jgi:hypothetical protein